jgi:hypothetical protein
MKRILFILSTLFGGTMLSFSQKDDQYFNQIYNLIEQRNYFKASNIYDSSKLHLDPIHQKYIEACLNNAFNKIVVSNQNISNLLSQNDLPDSLQLRLYQIKEDNHIKKFEYKEAKATLEYILTHFKNRLTENELIDSENNLVIWSALENEPKQETIIHADVHIKMIKDVVGLKNLKVNNTLDTLDFVFDTGANLSTVSESTAKLLNMKILPSLINVGTITGQKVKANIAICPLLHLDNITIKNAVFLVLSDEDLSFPTINYKIRGIIGYPIIASLKEVSITKDNYFIVNKNSVPKSEVFNMAMHGLTPLIHIDNKHFWLDTGAEKTILFAPYYHENKTYIEQFYLLKKVSFAGAGGKKEFDGFTITTQMPVFEKNITFKDITLLKEKLEEDESVYGNFGQDLIQQFDTMTLNFDKMYIVFE